jgi:hypothetical protein
LEKIPKDAEKTEPVINNERKKPISRYFLPTGGGLLHFTLFEIGLRVTVKFVAYKGLITGISAGTGIVIVKNPSRALTAGLADSLHQNLPWFDRQKFILLNGEKLYFDQCDQNLEYLFNLLSDPQLSFEDKKKVTIENLTQYLNLKTNAGRVNFVICIVVMLYIFHSSKNMASYYLVIKNLIEAIKQGKVSKALGRVIVRKLKKRGMPIDPELLNIINS